MTEVLGLVFEQADPVNSIVGLKQSFQSPLNPRCQSLAGGDGALKGPGVQYVTQNEYGCAESIARAAPSVPVRPGKRQRAR